MILQFDTSWLAKYEYWYHKEQYEFRKYKKENNS